MQLSGKANKDSDYTVMIAQQRLWLHSQDCQLCTDTSTQ